MAKPSRLIEDPGVLEAALEGLELQRQRIEAQIREIRALLAKRRGSAPAAGDASKTAAPRKRELSEAARKRIAAAQAKRWAEYRKKAGSARGKQKKGGGSAQKQAPASPKPEA